MPKLATVSPAGFRHRPPPAPMPKSRPDTSTTLGTPIKNKYPPVPQYLLSGGLHSGAALFHCTDLYGAQPPGPHCAPVLRTMGWRHSRLRKAQLVEGQWLSHRSSGALTRYLPDSGGVNGGKPCELRQALMTCMVSAFLSTS